MPSHGLAWGVPEVEAHLVQGIARKARSTVITAIDDFEVHMNATRAIIQATKAPGIPPVTRKEQTSNQKLRTDQKQRISISGILPGRSSQKLDEIGV